MRGRFEDTPLQVIAVGVDRHGMAGVRATYASLGIDRLDPFADATLGTARALGIRTVPTTLLIDAQGREVGRAGSGQAWLTTLAAEEIARRFGLAPGGGPAGTIPAGG